MPSKLGPADSAEGDASQRADLLKTLVTIRRIRWAGAGFALLQFILYTPPAGVEVPFPQMLTGASVALFLVATNLISLPAQRAPGRGLLRRMALAMLCADTALILGIIWLFTFDATGVLWPLLILPVIEGAYVGQLVGALVVWGVAAVLYAARQVWADRIGVTPFELPSLTYRTGMLLLVAVAVGYLARNLRVQMAGSREARAESERRAALLRTVAAASRTITTPDVETVFSRVVAAVQEIGFDTARIVRTKDWDGQVHGPDVGDELIPVVIVEGHTVVFENRDPGGKPDEQYRRHVATPISRNDEVEAVLLARSHSGDRPAPYEIECLELLASHAGVALENAHRFQERTRLEAQITHHALHDSLTELPNRALFGDRVTHARERLAENELLSVLHVDLDRFKKINDSLGHEAGDRLLQAVARRLEQRVRPGDTVSRLGGDEFAILLEPVRDVDEAMQIAERLLRAVEEPFRIGRTEAFISASVGIATAEAHTADHDLLREADLAMYRAKESGGGRCEIFRTAMIESARRRMQLESDLRRAIERDELVMHYQPILDLATLRVAGVESLVRWIHPDRGLTHPGEFIPLAEETGLIIPLGRRVLESVCRQIQAWERSPAWRRIVVSANVSAAEFRHPGFGDLLTELIARYRIDPAVLALEVTESVVMTDDPGTRRTLDRVRDIGIRLAIDDFGLGYSSLDYLKRFRFDILKIDRSFVSGVVDRPDDRTIVRSVLTLAQDLGLSVVAEGVETGEQLAYLERIGCDMAQGFYLHEPSDARTVAKLARDPQVRDRLRRAWPPPGFPQTGPSATGSEGP